MNSPKWEIVSTPSNLAYVTAGSTGHNWAVDQNGFLYFFDSSSWYHVDLPTIMPIASISAGTDDSVIVIDSFGSGYSMRPTGAFSSLNYVSTSKLTHIGAGDEFTFVLADVLGTIKRCVFGVTVNVPDSTGIKKLSTTAGLAHLWGVSDEGTIFKRENEEWIPVGNKNFVNVHVSLSSSGERQVVAVDKVGNGYFYTDQSGWVDVKKPPYFNARFISLEAGAGILWGVLQNGSLYKASF